MAPRQTRSKRAKRDDDYLPEKLIRNPTETVGRMLAALGKPLFYGLLGIVVGLAAVCWGIGRGLVGGGKLIWSLTREAGRKGREKVREAKWSRVRLVPLPYLAGKWPKVRLRPRIRIARWVIILTLAVMFGAAVGATWFYLVVLADLPEPGKLVTEEPAVSTKIYDRNGELLYRIYKDQNRTVVPLSEIPLVMRQATIAIEDSEFYSHPGFSWRGMMRATLDNLESDKLSGGSTITQQLVKNALLSPERTVIRKIKEVILAVMVERRYSKDEILEMYLNEVGYGGTAYGIEAAAETYFGKKAQDLDLAEATMLAGLPASPTAYSPFGARPELARGRQRVVLSRMVEEGFITVDEAEAAEAEEVNLAPQKIEIEAPHFVMWVKQLLVEKYGERAVEEGGLEVMTSLDLNLQKNVEEIVKDEVGKLGNLHITNGAALVTNPATGEVLAMVGSVDYFDRENEGNFNVTTAARQPGSSIKPVTYSLALVNGYTAAAILSDTPVTFQVAGQEPYSPKNYDGRFHGPIPLRVALASSYNVPAVKVAAALGINRVIEQGKKMGITTWEEPNRFGLSLTLGGGEVKMADMAVVYGTLANYGRRVNLQPILEVKNYKGQVWEGGCESRSAESGKQRVEAKVATEAGVRAAESECEGEQVVSEGIAFILTNILSDNGARTPAFGPGSVLNIPEHPEVAVKTGTTNNLKDNWTIGYTRDFLAVVWVGNNDNSPMSYVASGITGASPIWRKIMDTLLSGNGSVTWPIPGNVVQADICPFTGTLPCAGCPTKKEWFVVGTEPKERCWLPVAGEEKLKQKPKEAKMWQELVEIGRKRVVSD